MMKNKNKKGFTIVELVIVIAVIAILAAVLIPTFSNVVTKANESVALQEVKNAYTATLANDLATDDVDQVYNQGTIIVVHTNGTKVQIAADGSASVVATGTATHTLNNGLLTAVSPSQSTPDSSTSAN